MVPSPHPPRRCLRSETVSGLIRERGLCGAIDDIQMGALVAREASTLNDNGPREEGHRKSPEKKAQTTEAEPGARHLPAKGCWRERKDLPGRLRKGVSLRHLDGAVASKW